MTEPRRHTPTVACDETGCATPATMVIGTGRRLLGRQRLDTVRLLCAEHAGLVRRPLFALRLDQWLTADLSLFQRRWHRPAELDDYLRAQIGRSL